MWLIGLEMEQYVKGFQDHDINGLELLALNGSKLKVQVCTEFSVIIRISALGA